MKPFVKILTATTNFFVRLFNAEAEITDEKVTEEEIRMMIDVGEENGVLNETEKEMIDGIFEFDNTLAREVMTPRTDVFMIEVSTPMEKIITEVLEEGYSRIPVYEGDTDNIPEENSEHVVEYENLVFKIEKVNEKRIEFLKIYVSNKNSSWLYTSCYFL